MLGDPVVAVGTRGAGRVVTPHNAGELGPRCIVRDVVEWVGSHCTRHSKVILQPVDVDANHPESSIPRFDNFVVNPFAVGSIGADEHDRAGFASQLARDPTLDLRVLIGAARDSFPVVVRRRFVALDGANAANRAGAPAVRLEMKAVETFSNH